MTLMAKRAINVPKNLSQKSKLTANTQSGYQCIKKEKNLIKILFLVFPCWDYGKLKTYFNTK